jgi:hypothetical protein
MNCNLGYLEVKKSSLEMCGGKMVDNLLRRYLGREDRKEYSFEFPPINNTSFGDTSHGYEPRSVLENGVGTNEIIFYRQVAMTIRDFSNLIERTSNTSNRVLPEDYIKIQQLLREHRKTVCYYVIYSENDRRFKDIIAVTLNQNVSI